MAGAAPTCATCHMSATETQKVTHDVGDRISYTLRPVVSIHLKDWEKLRTNALMEDRMPAMHLEIGNRRFVVLSEDDYYEMSENLGQ